MLLDQLQSDLRQAQLNRDELKTSVLRLLLSEINNAKIAKGSELEDSEAISVVQKEIKKRKEAAEGFRAGAREDAAQQEESEAQILKTYLPAQLSNEELTKVVEDTITEVRAKKLATEVRDEGLINNSGAKSLSEMGQVIGLVMSQVGQGADGGRVSAIVREKLQGKL